MNKQLVWFVNKMFGICTDSSVVCVVCVKEFVLIGFSSTHRLEFGRCFNKFKFLKFRGRIMKALEVHQMEEIVGGDGDKVIAGIGCALGVISFGLAFASLVTATGGTALLISAAAYSIAPSAAALSCVGLAK
ncbi:MAG: hypothetical protein FH748_13780 [Balneolaceae bacterium]|nr:hypothetical protein [Balneolaceae bacterium]